MQEPAIFHSFGFKNTSVFMGLTLFMFIFGSITFPIDLFLLSMIRRYEFQADEFAYKMGRGKELQEGLKKIVKENKADLDPDPVYSAFRHSHPTLVERVRFISELERKKD